MPGRRMLSFVLAAALIGAGAASVWWFWPQPVRTIAVLPFVNVAKDADSAYLSDGIAEALITQLNRQPSIAVSDLPTVLPFKDRVNDAREVGRQLGVQNVVTGSVEQVGAGLTIATQLLDVATGRELWSSRYDRDAADLLDVQNEIASAIVNDVPRGTAAVRPASHNRRRRVRSLSPGAPHPAIRH
jgi:TolB-like protein